MSSFELVGSKRAQTGSYRQTGGLVGEWVDMRKEALMRSLGRTLRIMELLAEASAGVALADIARASELDSSTALRYLRGLINEGYATFVSQPGPRYFAGPRLTRLGETSKTAVLRQLARPHLEVLGEACKEDVTLGVLDSRCVVCIETRRCSHVLRANLEDGLRAPAHASSLGKAILAFVPPEDARVFLEQTDLVALTPKTLVSIAAIEAGLKEVRRRGYALDHEEYAPGVVCIGAPIFGGRGEPIGSLSITAPSQRLSPGELEGRYAALLLETCREISARFALGLPSTGR